MGLVCGVMKNWVTVRSYTLLGHVVQQNDFYVTGRYQEQAVPEQCQ